MTGAEPRWYPAPRAGDIVWCRFPRDKLPAPDPRPRPAIILRVGEYEGHPVVEVAYGTSQRVDSLYAGEFAITPSDRAAYVASGLSYPTKFDLVRTVELDFNEAWFAVPPGAPHGQTPKLGLLHPSLVRRVEAAASVARKGNPRQTRGSS